MWKRGVFFFPPSKAFKSRLHNWKLVGMFHAEWEARMLHIVQEVNFWKAALILETHYLTGDFVKWRVQY